MTSAGLVALISAPIARVDQPVLVAVEVAVGQQVADAVPGAVVEQQAAEHALFGLDRVRRHAQLRDLVVARIVVGRRARTADMRRSSCDIVSGRAPARPVDKPVDKPVELAVQTAGETGSAKEKSRPKAAFRSGAREPAEASGRLAEHHDR